MLYYSMPALAADRRSQMAVSSGVSDRKSDRISGKNTSEDFSENR